MHLLRRAITRASDAFRCVRAAQRRHGAGLPGTIARFADLYGRRQSKEAQLEMQMRLNPRDCWPRTEDKREFERYCRSHGLAIPRIFGVLAVARTADDDDRDARVEAIRVLASAPARDLISKPVDGVYGLGVYRLVRSDGGIVARGCGRAEGGHGFVTVARHPLTGIAFEGFRVPCWDAACRLVQDAATAFLLLRTIGWDVAITAVEPLLIEGNVTWDPAYEGLVGGEILDAVLRDAQRSRPVTTLRSAVPG